MDALTRYLGMRRRHRPVDGAALLLLRPGAIVGRAILGQVPTLSGGLLALAVLFGGDRRSVAVRVDGRIDRTEMHRHHYVALAVLEQNGRSSVLRSGQKIHPQRH